jgi:hypothetical protein
MRLTLGDLEWPRETAYGIVPQLPGAKKRPAVSGPGAGSAHASDSADQRRVISGVENGCSHGLG